MEACSHELSPTELVHLENAFRLAEDALEADEVPVGCVFTHQGVEVGRGRNEVNATRDPTAHAEMVALRIMREQPQFKEIIRDVDLFVTLEPCIMCASALYELGLRKIVFGACNERFGGIMSVGSREKYRSPHDIEIVYGIQAERSINLLKQFYDKQNPFAPEEKRKVKKYSRELNGASE